MWIVVSCRFSGVSELPRRSQTSLSIMGVTTVDICNSVESQVLRPVKYLPIVPTNVGCLYVSILYHISWMSFEPKFSILG